MPDFCSFYNVLREVSLRALIGDLVPNPWNSNEFTRDAERRMDESIRRNGMFKPIVVRNMPDGTLQILGGFHRWEAAKRAGYVDVPVYNLGTIDERQAKEISLLDNGRYGQDDAIKLAEILSAIAPLEELTKFMPMDEVEITSIIKTTDIDLDTLGLPPEEDEDGDADLNPIPAAAPPPKTHAVMRFKVPVADLEAVEGVIKGIIKNHHLRDQDSLINAGDALVAIVRNYTGAGNAAS